MDIKMREFLITFTTFLLGFVVESRVLYSNGHGDRVGDLDGISGMSRKNFDRGLKSGINNTTSMSSKNYNEVNSSPWEFDNLLGGGQNINNEPQTEFGQILYSLREMSSELQVISFHLYLWVQQYPEWYFVISYWPASRNSATSFVSLNMAACICFKCWSFKVFWRMVL